MMQQPMDRQKLMQMLAAQHSGQLGSGVGNLGNVGGQDNIGSSVGGLASMLGAGQAAGPIGAVAGGQGALMQGVWNEGDKIVDHALTGPFKAAGSMARGFSNAARRAGGPNPMMSGGGLQNGLASLLGGQLGTQPAPAAQAQAPVPPSSVGDFAAPMLDEEEARRRRARAMTGMGDFPVGQDQNRLG